MILQLIKTFNLQKIFGTLKTFSSQKISFRTFFAIIYSWLFLIGAISKAAVQCWCYNCSQELFNCSKSTIEILEKRMKYVHSYQ